MTTIADDRRRQILAAAEVIFARRGFHQASMSEVCEQAGMSPGSVYRYFRSKADIIAALVEENLAETHRRFEDLAREPDVVGGLHKLAGLVLGDLDDPGQLSLHFESTAEALRNPNVAELVRHEDSSVVDGLTAALTRGQQAGQVDPSLDPWLAAQTLVALVDGLTWRKFLDPSADTAGFVALVRTLLDRFLRPPKKR
jgi:AcrR family transcriptional regulator